MQKVARLLQGAGLAVKALTKASSEEEISHSGDYEGQKKEFTEATTQYFTLLSSVDVELRRQIHALEEADILPTEAGFRETQSDSNTLSGSNAGAGAKSPAANRSTLTGGGLGNLDIGWLNSRNDSVEKEMEAELWKKASAFLASLGGSKEMDSR